MIIKNIIKTCINNIINKKALSYITNEDYMFEQEPLRSLVKDRQVLINNRAYN